MQKPLPFLEKRGAVTQLIVDTKPFLMLGGELGNSSASDPTEFADMCEKLRAMHLNTVLVPVYWDRMEPEEGQFDFSLTQAFLEAARAHDLRVVLLWFGTWKNSMSCYVPGWVKRDTARFARARRHSGEPLEILSPWSEAARQSDARAFAALMHWLCETDGETHTVVMVQVENEIGMIPEARDHCPEATAAYAQPVPPALLDLLTRGALGPEVSALWQKTGRKTEGAWADVFGSEAWGEEVFSAWHFARYVESVASAGKWEYGLPLLVNAALMRPNYEPGQYPSAGPLPHLMEVWRAGAPSIDLLTPDIYFPNFAEWAGRYARGNNPLFIPEMAASARVVGNALYAIGQLGAMGVAPFAIETTPNANRIQNGYAALEGMASLILDAQQSGNIICLSPRIGFDWSVESLYETGVLGGVCFRADFLTPNANGAAGEQTTVLPTLGAGKWDALADTPLGAALIIQTGSDEFIILGSDVTVTFSPEGGHGKIGIEHVQEGRYDANGTWHAARWLNGDQTHQGRHIQFGDDEWRVQRIRLYRYE